MTVIVKNLKSGAYEQATNTSFCKIHIFLTSNFFPKSIKFAYQMCISYLLKLELPENIKFLLYIIL